MTKPKIKSGLGKRVFGDPASYTKLVSGNSGKETSMRFFEPKENLCQILGSCRGYWSTNLITKKPRPIRRTPSTGNRSVASNNNRGKDASSTYVKTKNIDESAEPYLSSFLLRDGMQARMADAGSKIALDNGENGVGRGGGREADRGGNPGESGQQREG